MNLSIEFIFEGKRWFDLMRIARRDAKYMPEDKVTQKIITAVKTKLEDGADLIGSRLASMDALYWPVNKYELETNYKLVQNEYYLSTAVGDDYEK